MRISRIAFTAEASNLLIGRYSCNPKTIGDYSTKNDELRKRFRTRENFICTPWIEHEIITLIQKLDWKLYGRCTHSYRRKTNISFTMESVQFILCHGECTICHDNNASEAVVITDTKKSRNVNHQIHWRPEQNAKDWITCPRRRNEFWQTKCKPSLCTSLYAQRMRCQKLSKKIEKTIVHKRQLKPRKDQK